MMSTLIFNACGYLVNYVYATQCDVGTLDYFRMLERACELLKTKIKNLSVLKLKDNHLRS